MTELKVTITAALEAEPNTVNFYGAHNLSKQLLKMLEEHRISYVTLHVSNKSEALQAAEFCAKNNVQYRIGGSH